MKIDVCRCTRYASSAVRYWPVIGLFSFSPCALLGKKRRTNPFLAPMGSAVASSFRLHVFLKRDRRFSNTRQGRRYLSIGRRSATVRLCRRKIALPRYQFGLNISALHPNIYVATGDPGGVSPVWPRKKIASSGQGGFFEKHGLFRWEKAFIPKRDRLQRASSASYAKGYQLKVIFSRNTKPQRKLLRCVCFCSGYPMNDSILRNLFCMSIVKNNPFGPFIYTAFRISVC